MILSLDTWIIIWKLSFFLSGCKSYCWLYPSHIPRAWLVFQRKNHPEQKTICTNTTIYIHLYWCNHRIVIICCSLYKSCFWQYLLYTSHITPSKKSNLYIFRLIIELGLPNPTHQIMGDGHHFPQNFPCDFSAILVAEVCRSLDRLCCEKLEDPSVFDGKTW